MISIITKVINPTTIINKASSQKLRKVNYFPLKVDKIETLFFILFWIFLNYLFVGNMIIALL